MNFLIWIIFLVLKVVEMLKLRLRCRRFWHNHDVCGADMMSEVKFWYWFSFDQNHDVGGLRQQEELRAYSLLLSPWIIWRDHEILTVNSSLIALTDPPHYSVGFSRPPVFRKEIPIWISSEYLNILRLNTEQSQDPKNIFKIFSNNQMLKWWSK